MSKSFVEIKADNGNTDVMILVDDISAVWLSNTSAGTIFQIYYGRYEVQVNDHDIATANYKRIKQALGVNDET